MASTDIVFYRKDKVDLIVEVEDPVDFSLNDYGVHWVVSSTETENASPVIHTSTSSHDSSTKTTLSTDSSDTAIAAGTYYYNITAINSSLSSDRKTLASGRVIVLQNIKD